MGKISKIDQNINAPVIAGVDITTDDHGRFNLNALHKASGGGEKDAPAKWLRNAKTKALISEIEEQTGQICTVSIEGRNGGTFAHEILAVEYAGWISAPFRIRVNQAFIDSRKGEASSPIMADDKLSREVRLQTRSLAQLGKMIGLEGNQLAISVCQGVERLTGVNPMGAMGITHVQAPRNEALLNPSDIGKKLGGISAQRVNLMLKNLELQTSSRNSKGDLVYEATEKGKALGAVMSDTGKRHGNGLPIRQLRWSSSIVDFLKSEGAA